METFLTISLVITSLLLSLLILVQQKGTGLSATFGGGAGGDFKVEKRGADKVLSRATVLVMLLFLANCLAFLWV